MGCEHLKTGDGLLSLKMQFETCSRVSLPCPRSARSEPSLGGVQVPPARPCHTPSEGPGAPPPSSAALVRRLRFGGRAPVRPRRAVSAARTA